MRNRPIGQERGEAGAVLGDEGPDDPLEPILGLRPEEDSGGTEADQSEEHPSSDRSPSFVHHS